MKPSYAPVKALRRAIARVVGDVRAATAVEYGLILALIVIGVIAAISGVGVVTSGMWNNTNAKFGAVVPR